MNIWSIILLVVHLILCVTLVTVILMQADESDGMSGAISGGMAETFFGKNKGRRFDQLLKRCTAVMAVVFLITSVALTLVLK